MGACLGVSGEILKVDNFCENISLKCEGFTHCLKFEV